MGHVGVEMCYFTQLLRGIIQGISGKNEPPNLKFTPGTPQKTKMAILAVFGLSLRITTFSYSQVWSPNYSFLSLPPNNKVVEHTKQVKFATRTDPLLVFAQKIRTVH